MFPITFGSTKVNFLLEANQKAFSHYQSVNADPQLNREVLSFVTPLAQLVSASERLMSFDWLTPLALSVWLGSFWYSPGSADMVRLQVGNSGEFQPNTPIINPTTKAHMDIYKKYMGYVLSIDENLSNNLLGAVNLGWSPQFLSDCNPTGVATSFRKWSFTSEFKASSFGSHRGVIVHDKNVSIALEKALKSKPFPGFMAPTACGIAAYGNDVYQLLEGEERFTFRKAVNDFFMRGSGGVLLTDNRPPSLTTRQLVALHPYGTAYMSSVCQYTALAPVIDNSPILSFDPKLSSFGQVRVG